jgi:hypothetical protein
MAKISIYFFCWKIFRTKRNYFFPPLNNNARKLKPAGVLVVSKDVARSTLHLYKG